MKILYHHRIRSKDGQFVHLEELIGALRGRGHDVVLVGPRAIEARQFGTEAGLVAVMKQFLPRFFYELMEFSYSFYAYFKLGGAIRRHRPDVIYERHNLFLPAGIWAKKRFGLPLLLEVNAPLREERSRHDQLVLENLARWSERYCWQNADYVLPVTDVLADRVRAEGVDPTHIEVIHNAINAESFADAPSIETAKQRLDVSGKTVIGFVGFVREWHGLDRVLEFLAEERRKDLHLLIVGDGPYVPELRKLAGQLGISGQISLTGVVPREQVAQHIAAFDVALQPAVVEYASPLKLFEYLTMHKAIVAPRMPNIEEVLDHGYNALLFAPGDTGEFKARLRQLVGNAALRDTLGANAGQTIIDKRISWDANAERVIRLFESRLDARAGSTVRVDADAQNSALPGTRQTP